MTWRRMAPYDEEAMGIFNKFFGHCVSKEDHQNARACLILEYGQEKADDIYYVTQLADTVEALWLCRDCIGLEDEELLLRHA